MTEIRDALCWACHRTATNVALCSRCPRSYHLKCGYLEEVPHEEEKWICPECTCVLQADGTSSHSPIDRKVLSKMLACVIQRTKRTKGSELLCSHVRYNYLDNGIMPMDLTKLEYNVNHNYYGTTEEFISDFKWLLHHSYYFHNPEYTKAAKSMLGVAIRECEDTSYCASCYLNANTLGDDEWFTVPCETPHVLVWAQVPGCPYWPGKVMQNPTNNGGQTTVVVHFFGDHSRASVPTTSCILYSHKIPGHLKKNNQKFAVAIQEIEKHVDRLKNMYGAFYYAQYRIQYKTKEDRINRKLQLPAFRGPFETAEFLAEVESLRCTRMVQDQQLRIEVNKYCKRRASSAMKRKRVKQELLNTTVSYDTKDESRITDGERIPDAMKTNNLERQVLLMPGIPLPSQVKAEDESIENLDSLKASNEERSNPGPFRQVNPMISLVDVNSLLEKPANETVSSFAINRKLSDLKALVEEENQSISGGLKNKVYKMLDEIQKNYDTYIGKLATLAGRQQADIDSERAQRKMLHDSMIKLRYETEKKIADIKRKQWCVSCDSEAIYLCCWNNGYCGSECQMNDWANHSQFCAQLKMPGTDPCVSDSPALRNLLAQPSTSGVPNKRLRRDH